MADVKWKGKQVEKTDFSKLEYLSDKNREHIDKEQLNRLLGEDKRSQSVSEQKTKTEQAFRERFGEAVPADVEMTRLISDSFHALKGKSVGSMEKGKRVKEAKEKLALRKHILTEQQVLLKEREKRREFAEREISQTNINENRWNSSTKEEEEALREWLFEEDSGYQSGKLHYNSTLLELNPTIFNTILASVGAADINEFIDRDDGEFASNYAKKYQKLCRLAAADGILKKYEKMLNRKSLSSEKCSITEVRAKIKFFQEMKKQYEDRMEMLSSPYYVLLRKADIKEYMGPDGAAKIEAIRDEKLRDYVKHFVECQSSPLAMGKNKEARSHYKAIFAEETDSQSRIDIQAANDFLEMLDTAKAVNAEDNIHTTTLEQGYSVEDCDESTQKLIGMMDDLTALFMSQLPEGVSYIMTVPPKTGKLILAGMTSDEIWAVEKDVLIGDIYEKGQIEGKEISREVLRKIRPMLDDLIQGRKRMEATAMAVDVVDNLSFDGFGYDFKNKAFQTTQAAKKLKPYVNYEGCPELTQAGSYARKTYMDTFEKIFYTLAENGYSVSNKYDKESLDENKVDEKVESWRQEMEKKNNKGKEKTERWDYPVIKVSGMSFRIFDPDQEAALKFLDNKSYQLDGEKKEEFLKLMNEQEKLSKQLFYGAKAYIRDNGFKAVVAVGYRRAYPAKMQKITDQIKKLVGEPVDDKRLVNDKA